MTDGLLIALLALGLGIAGLLSGMETGVFALSRFRIRRLARLGNRRALRLQRFLEHPENFLWTILLGNILAIWMVITVITHRLERWFGSNSLLFMATVLAVLFLLHIFVDLLPKLLFRRFPNRLSLAGVGGFRLLHGCLAPMVAVVEGLSRRLTRLAGAPAMSGRLLGSRAELRHAIKESTTALSTEELTIVSRILDLQNLRVRDVMTPMDKSATLDARRTVADLLNLVRERHVSYVPVWKETGSVRRILGVVLLASLLFEEARDPSTPLELLVRPALFVDESARLEDALRMMQRARQRLGVVLGPQRTEIGVITLNDILRAMFGEVRV